MSKKTAAPPIASLFRNMGQRALSSGGLAAVGGAGGAGLGGVVGGVRGYRKAQEEGSSGLSGALRGGLRGAAAGGTLGAAGGALAGAGSGKAQKLVRGLSSRKDALGATSRFGERQVHSLTGVLPKGMGRGEGLRAIGASPVETASQDLMKAIAASKVPLRPGMAADAVGADKKVRSLTKALEHAKKTEELGMTSLPGAAKAFATHPLQALKAGAGREWYSNPGVGGKLMAVGLPGSMVVNDALRSDDPNSSAASRGLASAGMMAPFSLTPMGFAGATAASTLLGGAGKRIGGRLQKNKQIGQPPGAPVPDDSAASGSVEHELSPRASGGF